MTEHLGELPEREWGRLLAGCCGDTHEGSIPSLSARRISHAAQEIRPLRTVHIGPFEEVIDMSEL